MLRVLTLLVFIGMSALGARAALPSIDERVKGAEELSGFHRIYWTSEGKLLLEISLWRTHFLYVPWLVTGVGSNDLGLDRGLTGGERLVQWERHGNKVLLIQPNLEFRASSQNPSERRAAEEAFAQSVLWGFDALAATGERVLVDATEFFLRDVLDLATRLKEKDSNPFRREPSRSALLWTKSRNFQRNTEVEALLTFITDKPGPQVRSVTPDPTAVTVRVRHSLVELPEIGEYRPREFDPRAGFYAGASFVDYSTPIGEPMRKMFIARHRLEKRDPTAAVSEAIRPIVYYLDPGTPEPVRTALLEGARWWAEAFESAGFRNAFRVEMLPEEADPLDLRYNVIQWVHRSTRGWSYGNSVVDPRTGEILKGHVTLGSLRVRQDYLIAEGLLAPYESGKPVSPEMERMALARLRQLSAHEVGHTLGLQHNYASSVNDRASVMDYPHPLIGVAGTGLDLSNAYTEGVGEWDKAAIAWGYSQFSSPAQDQKGLQQLLGRARKRGLQFITDADARAPGGAHPQAHLWDNNPDAAGELLRVLQVRQAALRRFGEAAVREGRPLALLEEALVPLYSGHRYQVEAAVKLIGGLVYEYVVREKNPSAGTSIVAPEQQRAAIHALLLTIQPETLALSENLLKLVPPRPPGYPRHRETFPSRTGVTFDPLAAAEAAANHTLELLLHPQRAARLVQHHARKPSSPSLDELLRSVLDATWRAKRLTGFEAAVQRTVDHVTLYHLFKLASTTDAPGSVRAQAGQILDTLASEQMDQGLNDPEEIAHRRHAASLVKRFRDDPDKIPMPIPLQLPPGAPI